MLNAENMWVIRFMQLGSGIARAGRPCHGNNSHVCWRRAIQLSLVPCLFLLCILSTGCSRFDRDWKTAVDTWQPADHTDISGPWKGTWQSEMHSSSGQLRCLISKTSDNLYHARFEGTYLNSFRFAYDVDLSTEPHLDRLHFTGATDLGAMAGGLYRYDGNANSTDFYCTYHSNSDHGHFTMTRPESP